MILAGDPIGHSQSGNNNAYCQDNLISWLNWDPAQIDHELLAFVERLIRLRQGHSVFRRRNFFQGRNIRGANIKDIVWLDPGGKEMSDQAWNQDFARCLGVALPGKAVDEVDERGQRVQDENFLLLMNAHHEQIPFVLPAMPENSGWIALVDTSCQTTQGEQAYYHGGESYPLQARSLALLVERGSKRIRATDRRRSASGA